MDNYGLIIQTEDDKTIVHEAENRDEIERVLDRYMQCKESIHEIIIIRGDSNVVFEWTKKEGHIIPSEEVVKEYKEDRKMSNVRTQWELRQKLLIAIHNYMASQSGGDWNLGKSELMLRRMEDDGVLDAVSLLGSQGICYSPPRLPTSPSMLDLARELEVELQEHRGGFRYICKNGTTVSVQWREGNYCKNDDRNVVTEWVPDVTCLGQTGEGGFRRYPEGYDCEDAEIAIINKEGKWHWFGYDTVFAGQSPDEVRTWIQWAEENEITPKPNGDSRSGLGRGFDSDGDDDDDDDGECRLPGVPEDLGR